MLVFAVKFDSSAKISMVIVVLHFLEFCSVSFILSTCPCGHVELSFVSWVLLFEGNMPLLLADGIWQNSRPFFFFFPGNASTASVSGANATRAFF